MAEDTVLPAGAAAGPSPPGFGVSIVGTFLIVQGLGIISPVLPDLADHWSLSASGAAFLLSSIAVGRLVFSLPGGALADRFGLRTVAVVSSAVVTGCAVVAATTSAYGVLLGAQAVAGMGSAAYTTAAMASIVNHTGGPAVGRMLARFQGAIVLGLSISPLLGGLAVEALGIRGPFWFQAGSSLLGLVLSVRGLPSIPPTAVSPPVGPVRRSAPAARARARAVWSLLRDRRLVLANVAGMATLWTVGGVRNTLVPLFAEARFGMRATTIGAILGLAALMNVVSIGPGGRIADKAGRRPSIRIGVVSLALTTALLAFVAAPWMLVVAVGASGLAKGLASVAPLAVVADVVTGDLRGTAVGIARTASELGLVLGPVMVGQLADIAGLRGAFAWSAVLLALVAGAAFAMPETMESRSHTVWTALRPDQRARL